MFGLGEFELSYLDSTAWFSSSAQTHKTCEQLLHVSDNRNHLFGHI